MTLKRTLLYAIISTCFLPSPYAMENDDSKTLPLVVSHNTLVVDQEDPPLYYKQKTLFFRNLIDLRIIEHDKPDERQEKEQDYKRIVQALEILKNIPKENNVETLDFERCLFERDNYLKEIIENCLNKIKKLKSIDFKNVYFTEKSFQSLSLSLGSFASGFLSKIKGDSLVFSDCKILERELDKLETESDEKKVISDNSYDRAKEFKQQALAKYGKDLNSIPTPGAPAIRAFAKLLTKKSEDSPASPRSASTIAKSDEEPANYFKQQALAKYAKDLAPQPTLTSSGVSDITPTPGTPAIRAFAKLRRDTSRDTSKELSSSALSTSPEAESPKAKK